jgi:hypothetical protein
MEYPQDLLPKSGCKRIVAPIDLSSFYLLRRTLSSDIFDSSTGQLKDEYLEEEKQEKRFLTWSCNLFNLYSIDHCFFNVHNKALTMVEWDFVTLTEPLIHEKDFTILEEFGTYFLSIGEVVENLQVPYKIGTEPEYYAKPYVYHCPNPCNFWHFELRWKDNKNDEIKFSKSAWKNKMLGTMRSVLRNYCFNLDEIEISAIPSLDEAVL